MGYGYYVLSDGREAGYLVTATCDREGCDEVIDRGLGYLCGRHPDGFRDPDEYGCGSYFCGRHDADHDCSNPWDLQTHPFVDDPDDEQLDGGCARIEKMVMDSVGQEINIICGIPRERHEDG